MMDIEEAFRHALDGNAVLFVGAGFSRIATNLNGKPFPIGDEFAGILGARINRPTLTQLDTAADRFIKEISRAALVELMKLTFTAKEIHPAQEKFGLAPWWRIYTTNYDNVLEEVYAANSKHLSPIMINTEPRHCINKKNICIHLNGYIKTLTEESLGKTTKLTRASYLTDDVARSPWAKALRADIEAAKAVIFVGYSMYDLDIGRIVFEASGAKQKTVMITHNTISEDDELYLENFGSVFKIGVDSAGLMLAKIDDSYTPRESIVDFQSFAAKHKFTPRLSKLSDDDAFALWVRGEYESASIAASITSSSPYYYLRRTVISEIFRAVAAGAELFLLHSALGNGKTLLCEGLSAEAAKEGYDVYWLERERPGVDAELTHILASTSKTLIIIEEYAKHRDIAKRICANKPSSHICVFTERTSANDIFAEDIYSAAGDSRIYEIEIDKLSPQDVRDIISVFNHRAFWKEFAALSEAAKSRKLESSYNSELQYILIGLLESKAIKDKLSAAMDEISSDDEMAIAIVLSLALSVIGNVATTTTMLADLIGAAAVRKAASAQSVSTREFLDIQRGTFRVRSPITAKYILQNLSRSDHLVLALSSAMQNLDVLRIGDDFYFGLYKDLMRFGNLEAILPAQKKREFIVGYFENIKNLSGCRENYMFWLQYAIARLSLKDFEKADFLFQTAYSYLNNSTHNSTHIDNHYARLLLERAAAEARENFIGEFIRAHDLLLNQMRRRDNRHYPYRVARNYLQFFNTYASQMSIEQKRVLRNACAQVIDTLSKAPSDLLAKTDVVECRSKLEDVLRRIPLS